MLNFKPILHISTSTDPVLSQGYLVPKGHLVQNQEQLMSGTGGEIIISTKALL